MCPRFGRSVEGATGGQPLATPALLRRSQSTQHNTEKDHTISADFGINHPGIGLGLGSLACGSTGSTGVPEYPPQYCLKSQSTTNRGAPADCLGLRAGSD